jgi:hypothetical protein
MDEDEKNGWKVDEEESDCQGIEVLVWREDASILRGLVALGSGSRRTRRLANMNSLLRGSQHTVRGHRCGWKRRTGGGCGRGLDICLSFGGRVAAARFDGVDIDGESACAERGMLIEPLRALFGERVVCVTVLRGCSSSALCTTPSAARGHNSLSTQTQQQQGEDLACSDDYRAEGAGEQSTANHIEAQAERQCGEPSGDADWEQRATGEEADDSASVPRRRICKGSFEMARDTQS